MKLAVDPIDDARYDPNFPMRILVEIAHEQSVDQLLKKLVSRAMEHPGAASIQIWLLEQGDRCATCSHKSKCPDQTRCLHLVAGEYNTRAPRAIKPSGTGDTNRRLPIGVGLIGQIAATGKQLIVRGVEEIRKASGDCEWLIQEGIRGINGTPIIFKGALLGVTAIFVRSTMPEEALPWGQIFADHIGSAIANARAFEEIQRLKGQLELQNTYLQEEVVEAKAFGNLLGQSSVLRQIASQIDLVAPTEASVLILGDTGTGKELVAHEIHRRSHRKDKSLVRVNCASIPKDLFESEFFGHVKGAFTGALRDRAGRFETAEGGTLFLDEIGEVPLEMQSKLLRVLQEKRYERVGDDRTRQANVRIIAATNRDLKQAAAEGRFREDLFYRLCVFPISVPPLRERREDIVLLASHFIGLSVKELKCAQPRLSRAAMATLENYDWPGNVRELRNVVERAVILAHGGPLRFDLPAAKLGPVPLSKSPSGRNEAIKEILSESEMEAFQRNNLLSALERTAWKIKGPDGAAELIGLKASTLIARMKKFGLVRRK